MKNSPDLLLEAPAALARSPHQHKIEGLARCSRGDRCSIAPAPRPRGWVQPGRVVDTGQRSQ